MIFSQ